MAKRATKTSDPWVGHNMAKRATETSEQMNRSGEQILLAIASTTSGQRLLATTSSAVPPIRPLYLKMPILPRGILPDAPWKVYPPFVGTVAGRQDSGPEARSYVAGGSGGRCPPCPGNSAGVRAELSACLPARGGPLAGGGGAGRRGVARGGEGGVFLGDSGGRVGGFFGGCVPPADGQDALVLVERPVAGGAIADFRSLSHLILPGQV